MSGFRVRTGDHIIRCNYCCPLQGGVKCIVVWCFLFVCFFCCFFFFVFVFVFFFFFVLFSTIRVFVCQFYVTILSLSTCRSIRKYLQERRAAAQYKNILNYEKKVPRLNDKIFDNEICGIFLSDRLTAKITELGEPRQIKKKKKKRNRIFPASILRKSTSGRHRPVSYPDGPMTARYRFT